MKTEAEIRQRIQEIASDVRVNDTPADVFVNAPLALIQVEGASVIQALEWALGKRKTCADSFPARSKKP